MRFKGLFFSAFLAVGTVAAIASPSYAEEAPTVQNLELVAKQTRTACENFLADSGVARVDYNYRSLLMVCVMNAADRPQFVTEWFPQKETFSGAVHACDGYVPDHAKAAQRAEQALGFNSPGFGMYAGMYAGLQSLQDCLQPELQYRSK